MNGSEKMIALLSNVTVDLIVGKLRRKYDFYIPEGFDTWVQEAINPKARLYNSDLDGVVVLLDGTEARSWKSIEEGNERISLWKRALRDVITRITNIPVFVSTIDFRENRINPYPKEKSELSSKTIGISLFKNWWKVAAMYM